MKTVKLETNEYVLINEIDISEDIGLCLSEIKEIDGVCERKLEKAVKHIPTVVQFVVGLGALTVLTAVLIVIAFINKELFWLFYIGLFGAAWIPLIALVFRWEFKKKTTFLKTADIYPAQITGMRREEEAVDSEDVIMHDYRYAIDYNLFKGDEIIKGTFKMRAASLFRNSVGLEEGLYNYYCTKRYMLMLFNPKNKRVYPVRLYKKQGMPHEIL
ncbi:MAG: hypothetical protein LBQ40_05390 [Clostridiales bacterium]|jgi:hypothetical protein|nr:hypothetical protein [Clostridiales bacterium]